MTLVDSSVWIDLFSDRETPETDWLRRELEVQTVGVPDLVVCEVLQGVRSDARFDSLQAYFSDLTIFRIGGEEIAAKSAANYRFLRAKGITVRTTIDCMIATFCIEERHELLHSDADFTHFEQYLGLRAIHP